MSNGIRSRSAPSRRAAWTLPATPPAGPDSTAPAASRPASAIGATPPCDWMIRVGPLVAGLGEPGFEPRQIARQHRADIGVDDGRRDPLELLDLRQHLGGQRDIGVGQRACAAPRRSRARGAGRARRAGSRPRPPRLVPVAARRSRRRARPGRAGSRCGHRRASARARQAQPARHELLGRRHAQIVAVVLEPLAHLDDVAMAFGGQEPEPGALAFEQRIGRDGRAVHDPLGLARAAPARSSQAARRAFEAVEHAERRVLRRRGHLGQGRRA